MNRMALAGAAVLTLGAGGYFAYDEYSTQKKKDEALAAARRKDEERKNRPAAKTRKAVNAPDLNGKTEDEAKRELTTLGLEIEVVDMGCDHLDDTKMLPVGQVCGQKPPPGTSMVEGAIVKVALETDTFEHGGAGTVAEWRRMPDLTGMHLDAALGALASKGFGGDEFGVSHQGDCTTGTVCATSPDPGERKVKARSGTLYVGK